MITHKQSISSSPERGIYKDRPNVIHIATENAKTMITAQIDKLKADQEAQALNALAQLKREEEDLDLHLRPHSYDPPVRHETLEPETVIQPQVDVDQQAQAQRIAAARNLAEQARLN